MSKLANLKIRDNLKNLSKLQKFLFVLTLLLVLLDWGTTILWAGYTPETEKNLFYNLGVPMGYLPIVIIPYAIFFMIFGILAFKEHKNVITCWLLFTPWGSVSAIFTNYFFTFQLFTIEGRQAISICLGILQTALFIYVLEIKKSKG